MYKELGRKLTSLTLLSILLASAVTFAAPGVMPAAQAANANLFVSAEDSLFSNTFGGPMVVEIVVKDSAISSLDDEHGEPDVTVNGNDVRMVQNNDGSWYAYIADRTQAQRADETQDPTDFGSTTGEAVGLDFGVFCNDSTDLDTGSGSVLASGSVGLALPDKTPITSTTGETDGTSDFSGTACATSTTAGDTHEMHVIREFKQISTQTPGTTTETLDRGGQIGVDEDVWPFIQLYDFSVAGTVEIVYNPAGGAQITRLTFDTMDSFARLTVDRSSYPQGADVHVTISDGQLDIDPTDEDSWTFGTAASAPQLRYQLFNEEGATDGDTATATSDVANINSVLSTLMFEDNGVLTINPRATGSTDILVGDDTADTRVEDGDTAGVTSNIPFEDLSTEGTTVADAVAGSMDEGTQPVTFLETLQSNGIFSNTESSADDSSTDVSPSAARGTTASMTYNKVGTSVVVANSFGALDVALPDDEWNSGEEIGIVVTDQDANKNSRVDEELELHLNSTSLIPALKIGTPFTLASSVDVAFYSNLKIADQYSGTVQGVDTFIAGSAQFDTGTTSEYISRVDRFSDRALIVNSDSDTFTGSGSTNRGGFVIDLGRDVEDLQASIKDPQGAGGDTRFKGLNMFNFDIRSMTTDGTTDTFGSSEAVEIYLLVNRTGTGDTNFDADDLDIDPIDVGDIVVISLGNSTKLSGLINLNRTTAYTAASNTVTLGSENSEIISDALFSTSNANTDDIGLLFVFNPSASATSSIIFAADTSPIVADFFTFGITGDGLKTTDRTNNAIYRFELEETADNTGIFGGMNVPPSNDIFGSAEYQMLNQLTIFDDDLYEGLRTIDERVTLVVHEDLTDEDAPRVNYLDLGGDGVSTQIADQEEARSHSAVVAFDKDAYKVADTVTVTLTDSDLNVDSERVDVFTTVAATSITDSEPTVDAVGERGLNQYSNGDAFGRLLDITFDDTRWQNGDLDGSDSGTAADCTDIDTDIITGSGDSTDDGLADSGFTLRETGINTGIFTGDFQIPARYCPHSGTDADGASTTGTDLEVNYVDFRDASGEVIEVGDGAGVRANTGSVSLDRTVYPVPFGQRVDFAAITSGEAPGGTRAIFPLHTTAIDGTLDENTETLGDGPLTIHVRVNDPDFDVSAAGEDTIAVTSSGGVSGLGPVKITVSRGSSSVILGYAGSSTSNSGKIDSTSLATGSGAAAIRQFGPMTEIAPAAGIFEADILVRYTDGPTDTTNCPTTTSFRGVNGTDRGSAQVRFDSAAATDQNFCILQGDIITVEYTDPTDASGDQNTVTDSATFDLRNGVLQSDKSVYIIGADMIMTLIEPDLDLDSDSAESYDLDLIEWDSDAAEISMGNEGGSASTNGAAFDPEPSEFRETGDSTGIFQIIIEIPNTLSSNKLDRGEEIQLEYTDWGPSGADFVGDEDEDIKLTIYTSNFGATVELDQKVYTWTDKVFITIVAPDHNFDSNLVDEIGESADDKIVVATRGSDLQNYKLVETGTDTGIFTGEVILTGFTSQDADGDGDTSDATGAKSGSGPTDGFLPADDDDGLTVSFEFTEDETVVGSALIRWNIGEVQFLEASYPATGQGVLRVVDPDLNLNPEAVDNFEVDVWSDSDAGGIDLTVTETNEATGIFEGIVYFSVTEESSGHRLRVAEGDTVTGEYEDNTLPSPYTTADELEVTATTFIGTIVPPLERAPASNPRIVDAFGNELDEVNVDQQVQVTADLANGQDRDQPFAYLVQIQDADGVTVSLSWITGSLAPGQSLNPAQSWTPTSPGTYTVQIFVWESVDNPDALSPPVSTEVTVV